MISGLLRRVHTYVILVLLAVVAVALAGALALGLGTNPATSNDTSTSNDPRSYEFDSATTQVAMRPDGTLGVSERIGFDFSGTYHGAFRDIPLRAGEHITDIGVSDQSGAFRPGGDTALGSPGAEGTFGSALVHGGHTQRIVWHYAASELHDFTLTYRLSGAVHVHGKLAELNFQVWGHEWKAPLHDLHGQLLLPPGSGKVSAWAHSKLAVARATVDANGGTVDLHARNVPEHHLVELHAVFPAARIAGAVPPAVVADAHPISLAKIASHERSLANDARARRDALATVHGYALAIGLGGALFGLVIAALLLSTMWRRWWREDDRIEQLDDGVAEPPDDLAPALVRQLVEQGGSADDDALVATLLEIVRRGAYRTVPAQSDAKGAQVDLALLPGAKDVQLSPIEQPVADIVDLLLAKQPEGVALGGIPKLLKRDKSLAKAVYAKTQEFQEAAAAQVRDANWTRSHGVGALVAMLVVAAGVAVLALGAAVNAWADYSFLLAAVAGAASVAGVELLTCAIIALCFPSLYRVYRPEAVEQAARWRGFRAFLDRMTDLGHEQTASLPLWERILVYGAAFGCATDVLRAMRPDVRDEDKGRGGLTGMQSGGLAYLTAANFASFSSVGSSASSVGAPSSSSSGSGGGGGFGGGSGGGGGGAW